MSSISKLSTFFKMRFSKLVDKLEDPRDTLEHSYEKQKNLLIQVKRNITDVLTSKKRLEIQLERLNNSIENYDEKAKKMMQDGNEELAKKMLERKHETLAQIDDIKEKIDELENEKEELMMTESKLTNNLAYFKGQKEVVKAQYTATQAKMQIGEALSGISEESTDIGNALENTREKTDEMKAKLQAIDELSETGFSNSEFQVDSEVSRKEISSKAQEDLEKIRQSL